VDLVAAEDTRHTLELLTHFEIRKPMLSCRAQNEDVAADKIIDLLKKQKQAQGCTDEDLA
ncbi:MAG: rRNA (cytidine-2'-O-)-methyltransferase, partial [Erysipelotrichaceae bacterium]|nr:rRNA (cytidine-2'-O-)-methyltransferase [Erysipelotrichaceae bacterium]